VPVKFANNAVSTLASGISNSATSITVASGQGALFPSLTGTEYFYATLIDASNNLEIVKCTARSSDVLTVTRAQESTSARAFATSDRIELRITAAGLQEASTGATGGGTDQVFYENSRTVTTTYSITTSKSAMCVGPLTINSGVTVTIPSGERLVIL
jgi:hypothetical protein